MPANGRGRVCAMHIHDSFFFSLSFSSFFLSFLLFFFFFLINHRGKEEVEVSSAGRNAVKDNPQGIATRQGAYVIGSPIFRRFPLSARVSSPFLPSAVSLTFHPVPSLSNEDRSNNELFPSPSFPSMAITSWKRERGRGLGQGRGERLPRLPTQRKFRVKCSGRRRGGGGRGKEDR